MNRGYHEIKEHGKREFPFNIYPCSIPVDFSHVALHWHEEMEIIAVKKGKGRITVDTVSYPVEEGDILAVFPGQLHAISCGNGERMEYENIIFRLSMLMGDNGDGCTVHFLKPLQEGQAKNPVLIQRNQPDHEVFGKVIQELDRFSEIRGNGYQLAVKGQLFCFCIMLMAEASCLQRRSRDMQERKSRGYWSTSGNILGKRLRSGRRQSCAFTVSPTL